MASLPPLGTQRIIDDVVGTLSANSDVPYRATLAEAVAEFPVGYYFKTDDKAGLGPYPGDLWIYRRVIGAPFYAAQIEGSAGLADIQAAVGLATTVLDQTEAARDAALAFGGQLVKATWTDLAAETGAAGDAALVVASDTGSHADPITGSTVQNAGLYQWSVSPAGWLRAGDLESTITERQAVRAENAANQTQAAIAPFTDRVEYTLGRPGGPTAGSGTSGDGVIPRQDATYARALKSFAMWTADAGVLRFARYSRTDLGGGTYRFDKIAEYPLNKSHAAGLVTLTEEEAGSLQLAENEHINFYSTGNVRYSSGTDGTGWIDVQTGLGPSKTSAYQDAVTIDYKMVMEDQRPVYSATDFRRVVEFVDNFDPSVPEANPFFGKKGVLLGNSLIRGQSGYGNDVLVGLEAALGCTFIQYSPYDGRSVYQMLGPTNESYVIGSKLALTSTDFAEADFAILNLPSSEFGNDGTQLGTIGDTGGGTCAGQWYNTIIAQMQTWKPSMRIIPVIDAQRFDGNGVGAVSYLSGDSANGNPTNPFIPVDRPNTLLEYIEFAREWLEFYGFPYIDLHKLAGLNSVSRTVLLGNDRLHYGGYGYENRFVPIMAAEMKRFGR